MTKDDHVLEDALHEAGNAAVELEQEAEEAAAKGLLGGAQMWGWIALALLVLMLLSFAR